MGCSWDHPSSSSPFQQASCTWRFMVVAWFAGVDVYWITWHVDISENIDSLPLLWTGIDLGLHMCIWRFNMLHALFNNIHQKGPRTTHSRSPLPKPWEHRLDNAVAVLVWNIQQCETPKTKWSSPTMTCLQRCVEGARKYRGIRVLSYYWMLLVAHGWVLRHLGCSVWVAAMEEGWLPTLE